MEMIGSKSFVVKKVGVVNKDFYGQVNRYLISSADVDGQEYLYLDEYQVNELISLLENVKELL